MHLCVTRLPWAKEWNNLQIHSHAPWNKFRTTGVNKNATMFSLLTHVCVTRPQWYKWHVTYKQRIIFAINIELWAIPMIKILYICIYGYWHIVLTKYFLIPPTEQYLRRRFQSWSSECLGLVIDKKRNYFHQDRLFVFTTSQMSGTHADSYAISKLFSVGPFDISNCIP